MLLQYHFGGGRVVRWCWVNFQCRGVLQFGSGWGWFGHFYSHLSFLSSFSLPLEVSSFSLPLEVYPGPSHHSRTPEHEGKSLYFLSPEHQSKLLYFCRTCFSKVRYRRPVFHPSFRPQLWVVGWCDGAG